MTVYYAQFIREESGEPSVVVPFREDADDGEVLRFKAEAHGQGGWVVTWTGPASFTAMKTRWRASLPCTRMFWVE